MYLYSFSGNSYWLLTVFFFCFVFVFLPFFEPLLWHKEVPRLGVLSELQLLSYISATATQIQAASVTYTTVHGNAGSLTH